MKEANKNRLNILLIPRWMCHKFNWHLWIWTSRKKALISARCTRCGMAGIEYHQRLKEESFRAIEKEKKDL